MKSESSTNPPLSDKATQYLDLLAPQHDDEAPLASIGSRLRELRQLILLESLPSDPQEAERVRPLVWKLLLRLNVITTGSEDGIHPLMDSHTYLDLTARAASAMFSKIRNDTFRTLATDLEFREKVGEDRLVRCLEAFVWRQLDSTSTEGPSKTDPAYVQGMNVLAAPFLYVLPTELEAFACFSTFIEVQAPRYVRPTLEGVHIGLQLVDLCLQSVDPELYKYLLSFNLGAELYAFPSLLTFSASTPPLREVLELWDFLLAWGVGLNVLCVVAQVWIMRAELLASTSPMKLLRTFPPLRSRDVIPLAVQFIGDLDHDLYSAVVRHPWDDSLAMGA